MDNNEAKNHPKPYDSLEHLIKDTCTLSQAQLEKEMEWAEQMAKFAVFDGQKDLPPSPILQPNSRGFQDLLTELEKRGITPKVMEDFSEDSQKVLKSGDFGKIKGLMAKKTEMAMDEEEATAAHSGYDKDKKISKRRKKGEETSNIGKGRKGGWIEPCKIDYHGKRLLLQMLKLSGTIAAGSVVAIILFSIKPKLNVVGRRSYEYQSRIRDEEKGDIVWNNQGDYFTELSQLEKAYIEIKEKLGITVLKLNYIPENVALSKVIIEERHARLEFINRENFLYVLEVIYPVDDSANRFSDRLNYKEVYNEWMEKWISIQKNYLLDNRVEYSAYFENENAYYYLQGILEENEFIHIVENLTLEIR